MAKSILSKCYADDTRLLIVQTDVTKMLTNLDHSQILESVIWLLERASSVLKKESQARKDAGDNNKQLVRWSSVPGGDDEYTTFIDDLVMIVTVDLSCP